MAVWGLGKKLRQFWGLNTLLLCICAANPSAWAQSRFFVIERQSLQSALIEFAEQAQLSINFSNFDLTGIQTAGSSRNVSKRVVLRQLLEGTEYGFRFIDNNSVELFKLPLVRAAGSKKQSHVNPEETAGIEELVVTAIKRPTTSFDLPVSVSGVSSIVLEDLGAYDFQTLVPHLAGVSTTNLGPGRNKIFVRGLSDGPFADRTQTVVGIYIDETPVNFSDTNPDIRLFDVDRIELIRGPQGTLYGAGSLGGIYKIVTTKPSLNETEAKFRAATSHTEGSGENALLDAVFNIPIIRNKLGFRFSGYADLRDGYIDDVGLGSNNVNDLEIYGARSALRLKIDETWTLDGVFNIQSIRYDDSQYFQQSLGRNKRSNTLQEPYSDDFIQASLTLKGKLGSAVLTSATAFVDRTVEETTDASRGVPFLDDVGSFPTELPELGELATISGVNDFFTSFSVDAAAYFSGNDIQTISHETRLQSKSGRRLEWLAGLFYLKRKQTTTSLLAFAFDDQAARFAFADHRIETTSDFALFGESVFRLNNKLSVTGGIRYSHSDLNLNYSSLFAPEGNEQAINSGRVTDKLIPKVALRYEWSDEVQSYFQMSVGYRVGGINIDTPLGALIAADPDEELFDLVPANFQSDTLVNYETGIKSYWFDRKLSLNLSIFYVNWFDIQSDQIDSNGLPFVTNVGNARNLGYEVEFTARLFEGFELRGSFFWNDSELVDDNPFLGANAGDRLPTIPENTVSLAALYQFDANPNWRTTIAANYAYIGASALRFDEDTSPQMGDYGILNASFQITNDIWKIGLYADNLTDTKANTFSFGNSFTIDVDEHVTPPRPRTFGIFFERKF